MSIAELKKISICGLIEEKSLALNGLQSLGCMHLLPLSFSDKKKNTEIESITFSEEARKALRFLSDTPYKRKNIKSDNEFDVKRLVGDALMLKQSIRNYSDKCDFLRQRIKSFNIWGDIKFLSKESMGGYLLWFYILPLRELSSLREVDLPWEIVRKDSRYAYVVLIAKQEPDRNLLPVMREHLGNVALNELKTQLNKAEVELEDLLAKRQALTRYIYLLSVNLAEAEDHAKLIEASQQTRDDTSVMAIQGWVADDDLDVVIEFSENNKLAYLIENPCETDQPPTLLLQPEVLDAGVDLALFYQVPSYRSWDPTWLLYVSFSLFFAMILADAGYGLVLMVVLLFAWQRLGKTAKGKSYRILGMSLFGCTILYGALVGSYFGVTPSDNSLLSYLHVLSIQDFDSMMKVSIIVGVIHISFANIMMAWVSRHSRVAISKLGWMVAIIGGLLWWLIPETSKWHVISIITVTLSLFMIIFFGSERPINRKIDYVWRFLEGVFSLKNLMNAFGDVLSYMRLFALGLASASLAVTFNDLAKDAYAGLPGLGFLAALLILIIGHILNLGLSLMSGVIHGLRLNFIEFYNWGLPEDGIIFRKFSRKEIKE
jgi:V/A-type H+-transporting ATPase subunit I